MPLDVSTKRVRFVAVPDDPATPKKQPSFYPVQSEQTLEPEIVDTEEMDLVFDFQT